MTQQEFIDEIKWFGNFYNVPVLQPAQMSIWLELFKDVPVAEFSAALKHHIKHDHYNTFPAPGKITAALDELEEKRILKVADRPNFTTLWMRTAVYFPGKQDYPHFPPENDEPAWNSIYDRIHAVPIRDRSEVVAKIIQELEGK